MPAKERFKLEQVKSALHRMQEESFVRLTKALSVQNWSLAKEILECLMHPETFMYARKEMRTRLLNTAVAKHFYLGDTDEDIDPKIEQLLLQGEDATLWKARKLLRDDKTLEALSLLEGKTDEASLCLRGSIQLMESGALPQELHNLVAPGTDVLCLMALEQLLLRNYGQA